MAAKELHPTEHNRTVLSDLQVGDLIEFPRGIHAGIQNDLKLYYTPEVRER
jgi:hypothetical protein